MWKRLDEQISLSEKWARLSWPALGTLIYVLANSDSRGRYPADTRIIKARCMTYRYDVRLELIEECLQELVKERALHLYDADGKRYLVIHDHAQWNPPGALRYAEPKYPDPPSELCECLRRENGAKAPLVPSSSLSTSSQEGVQGEAVTPGSPEAMILGILETKNCPSNPQTQRRYARGWITDRGFQYVEQACMDPWTKGKDVIAIHDRFFREPKAAQGKSPKRKVAKQDCGKCSGSGRRPNPVTGGEMDCGCVREVVAT